MVYKKQKFNGLMVLVARTSKHMVPLLVRAFMLDQPMVKDRSVRDGDSKGSQGLSLPSSGLLPPAVTRLLLYQH